MPKPKKTGVWAEPDESDEEVPAKATASSSSEITGKAMPVSKKANIDNIDTIDLVAEEEKPAASMPTTVPPPKTIPPKTNSAKTVSAEIFAENKIAEKLSAQLLYDL